MSLYWANISLTSSSSSDPFACVVSASTISTSSDGSSDTTSGSTDFFCRFVVLFGFATGSSSESDSSSSSESDLLSSSSSDRTFRFWPTCADFRVVRFAAGLEADFEADGFLALGGGFLGALDGFELLGGMKDDRTRGLSYSKDV